MDDKGDFKSGETTTDHGLSHDQLSELRAIFEKLANDNNGNRASFSTISPAADLIKHLHVLAIDCDLVDWKFSVGTNQNQLIIATIETDSLAEGAKFILRASAVQEKPKMSLIRTALSPLEQGVIRAKYGIENPILRKSSKIVKAVAANCLSQGIAKIDGGWIAACQIRTLVPNALDRAMSVEIDRIGSQQNLKFTIKDGCIFIGANEKSDLVAGLQALAGIETSKPHPINPSFHKTR